MRLNSSTRQVLSLISLNKGISRKKITELTALSPGSVTHITKQLIDNHYILEGNKVSQGLGRREVLLLSNPSKFCFLGIDIGACYLRLALADNSLSISCEVELSMADLVNELNKGAAVIKIVERFLEKAEVTAAAIDAIGIGITGIVDANRQSVINIPNLQNWDNIQIVSLLKERFACPVFLDEGGRTMALAEKIIGEASLNRDFIVVHIGFGVAAGFMIHDQLLRGAANAAGLLGHVTVDPHGLRCSCGNYGCLESIIPFIMLEMSFLLRSGGNALHLIDAYQQNDKIAVEVCIAAGQALGIALSNAVNLFNPQTIFLGGYIFDHFPVLFEETKRTIILRGNRFSTQHFQLERSSFGAKQGIMGALALAKASFIEEIV